MPYVLHRGPQEFPDGGYVETAWCEWDGRRFEARSRSSAIMELARRLVAAGAPDGPWRSVTLAGTPSMSGPSLRRVARLTVKEKDRGTVTIARYQERPNFVSGDGKDAPRGSRPSDEPSEGRHVPPASPRGRDANPAPALAQAA